ncbi:MAG: NAD(P)/FAD-dependent oxidoreductase [Patescibacteria group bacterium]|nr:NAD(P)/FAD-dependent oxidoreductase [Patescibacteria group bacterium]
MTHSFDVIVIGAGVAGFNIAQLLGKYKLEVLLIDSKKDPVQTSFSTLGTFLDPKRYGFSRNIVAAEINEVIFHSSHIHVEKKMNASILNKKIMYQELLDKIIKNNVKIRFSTCISGFSTKNDGSIESVVDKKGDCYKAKLFIDATGAAGFFSRKLGLQDKDLKLVEGLEYNVEYNGPQSQAHLFIGKLYQDGYAWIFPFGQNRAILGLGSYDPNIKADLRKRLDLMFNINTIKKLVKKDNDHISGGVIPVTAVKTKFVYKNVVCLGDSVSQVHPIVGEGHRFILEAGIIAAPYIRNAIKTNNFGVLKGYEYEWNKQFYKSYFQGKKLQGLASIMSHNDFLSDLSAIIVALKGDNSFKKALAGHV